MEQSKALRQESKGFTVYKVSRLCRKSPFPYLLSDDEINTEKITLPGAPNLRSQFGANGEK
jgi:hypothetical protein